LYFPPLIADKYRSLMGYLLVYLSCVYRVKSVDGYGLLLMAKEAQAKE
jgi:hypothetical protein